MIFKYLTSIVKPCVFKLFSLRKITKSNFYHHLPTLNIANLFMQSFASPFPQPPHQSPTPQKSRTTFYTTPHKKGATIAYTHALSMEVWHKMCSINYAACFMLHNLWGGGKEGGMQTIA